MAIEPQSTNQYVDEPTLLRFPLNETSLKIIQINIRGLNDFDKLDSLCIFLRNLNTCVDVIVVGETWIKQDRSQFYNIPGYISIHSCRSKSSGGLALFIRNGLNYEVCNNISDRGHHRVAVKIKMGRISVSINGLYRPPDGDTARLLATIEDILSNAEGSEHNILAGDINIPVNRPLDRDVLRYLQLLNSFSMVVTNTFVTRPLSNNILDHVISSVSDAPRITNFTMECELSDHNYVLTELKLSNRRESKQLSKTRVNYNAVDSQFHQFLVSEDWTSRPVNARLQAITGKYAKLVEENSTTTTVEVKVKNNCCPWYNFDIWKLGNIRDSMLKKWKRNRQDARTTELLAHANRKLAAAKTKARIQYHSKLFNSGNPKMVWSRINELMGGKSKPNSPISLVVNLNEEHDPMKVANVLNEHFVSVGCALGNQLTSNGDVNHFGTIKRSQRSFFLRPSSSQEVFEWISTLDPSKATGYDRFPIAALKKHSILLSTIISDCFNESISHASYPTCLKKAIVFPVFKSGNPKDPNNYRPISVLPAINKIFEKLIFTRLNGFLTTTKQLYQHQFGFRQGSTTEVAVVEMIDEISKTLDRKLSAGAVFLDLSKAFDTINHEMLLKKLDCYGVRGHPNYLLASYLEERAQQVVVSGVLSDECAISCGVPQGSVLGPLLFLLYVNDLSNLKLHGMPRLFADDTAISYTSASPTRVVEEMREDMEVVQDYLTNNLLALNIGKTKFMLFRFPKRKLPTYPELTVRGERIEEVATFKYLGVHIDNRLSWSEHVEKVATKCSALSGVLRKLSKSVPQHVLLKMYHAFIQSRYQYAIAAWGTCCKTHLKVLQVQQNRCIKSIYKLHYLHPTRELYTMPQHNILPINGLYTQRIATVMFKAVKNLNLHHNWQFRTAEHRYPIRTAHHLRQSDFRTETGRKRFLTRGPHIYNNLPEDLKQSQTLSEFKRKLVSHIRSHLESYIVR